MKKIIHPSTEVLVVAAEVPSDDEAKCINLHDSFISFTNLAHQRQSQVKAELIPNDSNSGNGACKLWIDDQLEIVFHRVSQ